MNEQSESKPQNVPPVIDIIHDLLLSHDSLSRGELQRLVSAQLNITLESESGRKLISGFSSNLTALEKRLETKEGKLLIKNNPRSKNVTYSVVDKPLSFEEEEKKNIQEEIVNNNNNPWIPGIIPFHSTWDDESSVLQIELILKPNVEEDKDRPHVFRLRLNDPIKETEVNTNYDYFNECIMNYAIEHKEDVAAFNWYKINPNGKTFQLEVLNYHTDIEDEEDEDTEQEEEKQEERKKIITEEYGFALNMINQERKEFTLSMEHLFLVNGRGASLWVLEKDIEDENMFWISSYPQRNLTHKPYLQCIIGRLPEEAGINRDSLYCIRHRDNNWYNVTRGNVDFKGFCKRPSRIKNSHAGRKRKYETDFVLLPDFFKRVKGRNKNGELVYKLHGPTYTDKEGKLKYPSFTFTDLNEMQKIQTSMLQTIETRGLTSVRFNLGLGNAEPFEHIDFEEDQRTDYGAYDVNRPALKYLEYRMFWCKENFGRLLRLNDLMC